MTNAERAEKLLQAAQLVSEVYCSLEKEEHECEHCHRTTYTNWDHHLKGDMLKATRQKLERLAHSFTLVATTT